MKQAIIFIIAVCSTVSALAQSSVFTGVAINHQNNRTTLSFSTPQEVNVRYYSIEASHDNKEFKIIGRVRANSNSMRTVQHNYSLAGHNYAYYRVAQVNMDGSMPYSNTIAAAPTTPDNKKYEQEPAPASGSVLANR